MMPNQTFRVLFFGSGRFALPTLRALREPPFELVGAVTQPDRPSGRGRPLLPTPVKQEIEEWGRGVKLFQPVKVSTLQEDIEETRPDALVVADYGRLIPSPILEIASIVNLHPSLLPRHRGPSPIQTALLEGDDETGVTLMELDAELDHGPIIAQRRIPIGGRDTAPLLSEKLAELAAELTQEELPRFLAGGLEPVPQDHDRATFTKKLERADGRIDWSRPDTEIDQQIRALQLWPGTFTIWEGQELKILEAEPVERTDLAPGQVDRGELIVGCGRHALKLLKLQLPGGRPLPAAEFLRGHPELLGSRLG